MKNIFKYGLLFLSFLGVLAFTVESQAAPNIQFPISELGGCESKEDCFSYCEEPKNMNTCLDFGEKSGLMSQEEISSARKFLAAGGKGPGDCTSKRSCEAFCSNIDNMRECIAYAEQHGIISGPELEEAKKISKFLESGGTLPGGCRSKSECEAYCSTSNPNNMRACIMFAKEAGFLSAEELRNVDMVLRALEKGVAPPKCRGDEECAIYCARPENLENCIQFSLASGRITEREAELMRKYEGKGPGGCIGKACETFCDDPANEEACFNFSKDYGRIPANQDYKTMIEGRDRFRLDFEKMPITIQECLRNSIGSEIELMLKGNPPSQSAQVKMENCWKIMEVTKDNE